MFATFWALPRGIYSRFNLPFFHQPSLWLMLPMPRAKQIGMDSQRWTRWPPIQNMSWWRIRGGKHTRLEEVIHSIQSPVTQYIICGSSLIVRLWYFSPSQHLRVDHSGAHYHCEVIRCSKAFVHLRIAHINMYGYIYIYIDIHSGLAPFPIIVANEGM